MLSKGSLTVFFRKKSGKLYHHQQTDQVNSDMQVNERGICLPGR